MAAEKSQEFYQQFLSELSTKYKPTMIKGSFSVTILIKLINKLINFCDMLLDGKFGAYMSINITNDGPVTISLDSQNKVIGITAFLFK